LGDLTRLQRAFTKATRGDTQRNTWRAKLGDNNRRLQTGRTNYVWARVQMGDGLTITEVLCLNVAPTLNLDVIVYYNEDNILEVKKLDPIKGPEFYGDYPGGNVGPHAWSHGRLAPDPLRLDSLQVKGLLVTPTDPPTTAVNIGSWFYQTSGTSYAWWPSGTVELSNYIPTQQYEQRPVLVGLSRTTGSPQVIAGTAGLYIGYTPYQVPFTGSDVAAIVGTAEFEAAAGVRLRYGMGTVENYDIFLEARRWVGGGLSTSINGGDSTAEAVAGFSQLRLTSVTGDPVPSGDNSPSSTIYLTEYVGQQINLYNTTTSKWEAHYLTSEISLSISGLTASYIYDVFVYDNSGTLTLQVVSWGGSSSRATALGDEDGIRVMESDHSKLYVGKIYVDSGGGTVTQSLNNNGVSNYYNRRPMPIGTYPSADSWLYNSATVREWGGGAGGAGAVNVLMLSEPYGFVGAKMISAMQTPAANTGEVAFGLNTTTSFTSPMRQRGQNSRTDYLNCHYDVELGEGLNILYALERCDGATGNVTFFGDGSVPTLLQCGFTGHTWQ